MHEKIRQLEDKILQLKHHKEQAEIKIARALLRKVQAILGQDCDISLVTCLLQDTWTQAIPESKEVWRARANTFRHRDTTKVT